MNALVNACTAFSTYGELLACCDQGYVPTLHGRTRRERILIRVLKCAGYRVWGNRGKNW